MTDRFERDLERMLAAGGDRVDARTRQELSARRRAVLDADAEEIRRHFEAP